MTVCAWWRWRISGSPPHIGVADPHPTNNASPRYARHADTGPWQDACAEKTRLSQRSSYTLISYKARRALTLSGRHARRLCPAGACEGTIFTRYHNEGATHDCNIDGDASTAHTSQLSSHRVFLACALQGAQPRPYGWANAVGRGSDIGCAHPQTWCGTPPPNVS